MRWRFPGGLSLAIGDKAVNMQLQYALTQDDYYEFNMAYLKHRKSLVPRNQRGLGPMRWVFYGVAFLLLAGVVVVGNLDSLMSPAARRPAAPPPPSANPFISVLPFLVLIFLVWLLLRLFRSKYLYRRISAQSVRLGESQSAEITDQRLPIRAPGCVAQMEWSYFIRFIETKSTFSLFVVPRMAHILPKRAFASTSDLEEFRAFAQAHVGNQPIGFPVQQAGDA